jgi:hypothetical protein
MPRHQLAYLVRYADSFDNFKQGLTQPLTIVSIAKLRETKETTLELPLCLCRLLDPMTRNCKIAVCVSCLPRVACQIDFPSDCRTLDNMKR